MFNDTTTNHNVESSNATTFNEFTAEKSARQVAGEFLRTYRTHAAKYLNAGDHAYIQIHASSLPGENYFPRVGFPVRGTVEDIETALDAADRWSAEGRNLYFPMNPMKGQTRRSKPTVAYHCFNSSDADVYKVEGGMTQGEGLRFILGLGVHPNFTINSGQGLQPLYFTERTDYEGWSAINLGIFTALKPLGADKIES